MLLYSLNKKEKEQFLDIVTAIVKADGNIDEVESLELKILSDEMGDDVKGYTPQNPEQAIKNLTSAPSNVKRTILLNLIIASISDDFYHAEEHLFVDRVLNEWDISLKVKSELFKLVYNYKDLREKAKYVVNS